jgi:hypothetical protein
MLNSATLIWIFWQLSNSGESEIRREEGINRLVAIRKNNDVCRAIHISFECSDTETNGSPISAWHVRYEPYCLQTTL